MPAERAHHWVDGTTMGTRIDDTGATVEVVAVHNYVWDGVSSWVRETQPGGGTGGGGGAVTVADGADVAQGATSDVSSANTVIGLLKAIKAAVQGTLTVGTHAVTQSGVWTAARSWTLSSATDSVNVGNFPATQGVSGSVSVSNFPATQPVSGSISVSNFPATQPVSIAATIRVDERSYTPLGAYRAATPAAITGAASSQNLFTLHNPVGSGRTVRIKRLEIQGVFASTTASATAFLYHVGRTTGIPTGGAAITSQKHATADSAPVGVALSGSSAITATAATGDLWTTSPGTGSANAPSVLPLPIFAEGRDDDDIILVAGEAILVRADTNTTSWKHSVDISWVEY